MILLLEKYQTPAIAATHASTAAGNHICFLRTHCFHGISLSVADCETLAKRRRGSW
jgi:hypothetical protein